MKKYYYLFFILLILVFSLFVIRNNQKNLFKEITSLSLPSYSYISSSSIFSKSRQKTYMIIRLNKSQLEQVLLNEPPFSLNWNYGAIPDNKIYGMKFSKELFTDNFGHGKVFGSEKLINIMQSEDLQWSISGDLIDGDVLKCFIVNTAEGIIYTGVFKI